jgi:hypothetical protein
MPRTRKTQSKLTASTSHRLNNYALAAGAAGVSLLALAQPSEAEIVYTPVDGIINRSRPYQLDLNNDGIVDFTIIDHGFGRSGAFTSVQSLFVRPAPFNRVNCAYPSCLSTFIYAAALHRGSEIGPPQEHGWLSEHGQMALDERLNKKSYLFGAWSHATDRYLGLRFQIDGQNHFGWARISVILVGKYPNQTFEAHLTGYAYETVANQSIKAGEIGTGDAEAIPDTSLPIPASSVGQFASLGALALGSDGTSIWRREETESAATAIARN